MFIRRACQNSTTGLGDRDRGGVRRGPSEGVRGLGQGCVTLHPGARPGHGADRGPGAKPRKPPFHTRLAVEWFPVWKNHSNRLQGGLTETAEQEGPQLRCSCLVTGARGASRFQNAIGWWR